MENIKYAVTGAGSNLGREILQVLAERAVPREAVAALGFGGIAAVMVAYGDEDELPLQAAESFDASGTVVIAAGGEPSALRQLATSAQLLIDLTGGFLGEGDVPAALAQLGTPFPQGAKIVACPSPISSQLARALLPLHEAAGAVRVVAATYQSVSTAGRAAMDELFTQTRAVFVNDALVKERFPKQIAFNVIPQVGALNADGHSAEEFRTAVELKKLIAPKLKVAATCAFAPLFIGGGIAVTVEFEREISATEAAAALRRATGVVYVDERVEEGMITPAETAGEDGVYVSRLREDPTVDSGLSFFIAGDTLRRAALDAVGLVEAWGRKRLN